MTRREFTTKIKVAAFKRAEGFCEACGAFLQGGRVEYDHRIPDALGGDPTLENCEVLCKNCHGAKTAKKDVPQIAKAKRVEAQHIGAKTTRNPLPGSKASKFKKRIDGTVVRRDQ